MPENPKAHIQGLPVEDIVDEFGTPLFIYDAQVLSETYRRLAEALPDGVEVLYSLKANPNISVCGFLGAQGAGAEVSSLTELMTAMRAGVDPADIIFLGPGKSRADLEACVSAGISAVVCESLAELRLLDEVAAARGPPRSPRCCGSTRASTARGPGCRWEESRGNSVWTRRKSVRRGPCSTP